MSKEILARRLNRILLWLFFVLCLVSTFHYHQIYRDGSPWAYQIFNRMTWMADKPHLRYSSVLLQLPAILSALLFENARLSYWFYCLGYMLYPFLALAFLSRVLRKKGRADLLYPMILSFFLTIVPVWSFSNSITCETVVIYWFIFAYVIVSPRPRIRYLFLLNILLFFSYESGHVFYLLTLYLSWREKKLDYRQVILSVVFITAQNLNLFLRIFPSKDHAFFLYSLPATFHSPFWIVIFTGGITLILCSLRPKWLRAGSVVVAFAASCITAYLVAMKPTAEQWIETYDNRVWCIPVAWAIFVTAYEILRHQRFKLHPRQVFLIFILAIPPVIFQLKLSWNSYLVFHEVQDKVNEVEGCYVLSKEEQRQLTDNRLQGWDFPYYSIIANNSKKIHTILFKDYEAQPQEKRFCKEIEGMYLEYTHRWGVSRILTKGNYDFSAFQDGRIRNSEKSHPGCQMKDGCHKEGNDTRNRAEERPL